tara:strand:- start:1774 stop:2328 length:555 start_codon:yes stop_codon:yes gene_type:complete
MSAVAGAAIGATVRVTTSLGETIEGRVFTHDEAANVVVVERPGGAGRATFQLLNTSTVKELTVLAPPAAPEASNGGSEAAAELPSIKHNSIAAREERALSKAAEDALLVGDNVTAHAQDLFEALNKTMPCMWYQDTIIVLKEVAIRPPYTPETCQKASPSIDAPALERVRKVLAGLLAKRPTAA